MSSQDNELEGLIKELAGEENENMGIDSGDAQGLVPDLDAVAEMTEEEIEERLLAGIQSRENAVQAPAQEDVLDMLGTSEDDELPKVCFSQFP